MRSHHLQFAAVVLLTTLLFACNKKESGSDESSDEWPEMDSFHMIIADAYHPFKDSANLAPAKKLAEEMAWEAVRWQEATLPKKVDNDDMRVQLEKLKMESRAFADQVKANASDAELGNSLTSLHESFHKAMEMWYGEKH
jgi:hypothetical protein